MLPVISIFILTLFAGGIFYWRRIRIRTWRNILEEKINNLYSEINSNEFSGAELKMDGLPKELSEILNKIRHLLLKEREKTRERLRGIDVPHTVSEQKRTIDNLYIVNELGRKVTSSLSLDQTFQHLYTMINSMMDAAVLELAVGERGSGERMFYSNISSDDPNYFNNMAEWSFKNLREVYLTDAENDYARYVFKPLVLPGNRPAGSVMVFPIMNGEIVRGTLSVISFQKNSYQDYHREIIRLLLGYISVAIENAMRHEELNIMKLRAEKGEKFKEQFLANMSHEIRTPINAVTGMTYLLLEKQPRQDQLRYLNSIRIASDALLVIINDILDLSKIEAGKIEFEQINFSVKDLVKNVEEIMRFKAQEKGLNFEVNTDPALPQFLIGDPARLTQILINLVGNAIKFTDKGSVTVRMLNSKTGSDEEENKVAGIRFEVEDTGIGMSQEQQTKLFQDYAQASSDTSRKYGGTGLGLSISKRLVNLLGGTIGVESELNRGSLFYVLLSIPVSTHKQAPPPDQEVPADMPEQLMGIHVLLADDNEYNRIVISEMLSLRIPEIRIDVALDGKQAIEMVMQNDYDLVLMDLIMPHLNGLEATNIIRNEMPDSKRNIPILALTASVVNSEIQKCKSAGMNGFIPKPFKSADLYGTIYRVMKGVESFMEKTQVEREVQKSTGSIDMKTIEGYSEGDEVRMTRFIKLFLQKVPDSLKLLAEASDEGDFDKIRIVVHSLKPQLQFTGVKEGFDLAEKIEQNCLEEKNMEHIRLMIYSLNNQCMEAMKELNTLRMGKI